MRTGVLGGSFDPPHLGHLGIATAARSFLHLDRVLFVPCYLPAHKAPQSLSPFETRWQLLQEALSGRPGFEAAAIERERGGVSYTVDTLKELRAAYPEDEFWLILGEDSLADLPGWRTPEEIARLARIAVYPRASEAPGGPRPGSQPSVASGERREAPRPAYLEGRVSWIPGPRFDISSTEVRRRARAGLPLGKLVPVGVARSIGRLGLYRV
ncbi:MAG: nicotinate-nucleotide adenylyltransferase [Candidatus Eisenbacteria bacterium]|nr:nicotinate-nucleotide adenylyltransferase [Candidatus Eisenbacteria bacterium]